jgi:hypothetical protein
MSANAGSAPAATKPVAKEWRVSLYLSEEGTTTRAKVVLETGDNVLEGRAQAHRNPHDPSVPAIGDELAAGRALADLGQQLIHAAAVDVGAIASGGSKREFFSALTPPAADGRST